jgi:hypothetical protein
VCSEQIYRRFDKQEVKQIEVAEQECDYSNEEELRVGHIVLSFISAELVCDLEVH